ncbi:TPA: class III lanthionine synthetase LanKC [Streptococcus suis]|uniref:class III lanthionine synthetase LanKC n=1 Tax=Streptococcus suis TaxID=1307 RepID=UPI00040692FE|nr:class III lanthionine synthetase LanKC [Streptococcus suis]MCO8202986.1 class III lanthionine synthetase LanKC [Streptococcus suis]HEM3502771.1 class III lanthionine synthetase LanKC [Streptococcus suis]HEM3504064.1 class III lanthionine synthetase LanKC [Streptococcus suis]
MDLRYEMYISPRYKFYRPMKNSEKKKTRLCINDLPSNWYSKIDKEQHWHYCGPMNNHIPPQGWKIHISSTIKETQKTLDIVSKILINRNTHFKFVMSSWDLFVKNSKYGDRSSSGKFITIYPATEYIFFTLVHELHQALSELERGPYILNDNRWLDGNVYFRYGAFIDMKMENGESGIFNQYGVLIPDERRPEYVVPDFVEVPLFIEEMEQQKESGFQISEDFDKYDIYEAIHFSNGGGVYKAKEISTGREVIIKEGRFQAGLDSQGNDAFNRLEVEYKALTKLENVAGVVRVLDFFKVWEHNYIVEEVASGQSLQSWVPLNYPFSGSNIDRLEYSKLCSKIISNLKDILEDIHNNNVGMGDLSPNNIIIDDMTMEIKLIDFETAGSVDETFNQGLQTPGFGTRNSKTRREADWFSFTRICYFLLMPIIPIQDISKYNEDKIKGWVKSVFGIDLSSLIPNRKQIKSNQGVPTFEYGFQNLEQIIEKVRLGIISHLHPSREQLIPGDIRQYESSGGMINILTGGFGVVMALHRTGGIDNATKKWVEKYSSDKYLKELDSGLFTGRAGIACLLYELGYTDRAKELINSTAITSDNDISITSGLAGHGLALLSFYSLEQDIFYLELAKKIADEIETIFNNNVEITSKDIDFIPKGLLDGWSGVSVFLCALYNCTKNEKWLSLAESAMMRELESCSLDSNGSLQVLDEMRLLPYLSSGGVGLSIALHILNKYSDKSIFKDKFLQTLGNVNNICSYNSGLFRGFASFLLFSSFINQECGIMDEKRTLSMIDTLQVYMVESEDKIMMPGDYGYKLSGDLFTGAAGVLLALDSVAGKSWRNCFPLINKSYQEIF